MYPKDGLTLDKNLTEKILSLNMLATFSQSVPKVGNGIDLQDENGVDKNGSCKNGGTLAHGTECLSR